MRTLAPVLSITLVACAPPAADRSEPAPSEEDLARYDRYRRPAELVAALELRPGDEVADVGAGTGYLTVRLAEAVGPTGRVVATDIDAAALRELDVRVQDARVKERVVTRRVAPDEPGLEPGRYDRVLLAQVDHLVADRAAYFARLKPALAPRGRIAIANRLPYRKPVLEAATRAGLRPAAERSLPGQFLILFEVTP